MKIFGYYPAAILAALTAVLAVVTNLPGVPLSGETAAWIVTVASALFTALEAWTVRPVTVPMLSGAVRTTIAAAVLFGVPIDDTLAGSIVAAVAMIFGLLTHNAGTPAIDPAPGFLRPKVVQGTAVRLD